MLRHSEPLTILAKPRIGKITSKPRTSNRTCFHPMGSTSNRPQPKCIWPYNPEGRNMIPWLRLAAPSQQAVQYYRLHYSRGTYPRTVLFPQFANYRIGKLIASR